MLKVPNAMNYGKFSEMYGLLAPPQTQLLVEPIGNHQTKYMPLTGSNSGTYEWVDCA